MFVRWERERHLIRVGCEDKSTAKSVNSVLQPLSLGFPAGEPMPVDFVRAVAKSVVEVAAPYNVWERVPSIFASFVGR